MGIALVSGQLKSDQHFLSNIDQFTIADLCQHLFF
ncbi:Uncharacterised protein [Vibrio cholerae]|nr:Uncharacterised protein [Vibrio cholerae]